MRPFTVYDVPQRSGEWFQLRAGLLTGSCAYDVLAQRKRGSGELEGRIRLRRRLVAERITGLSIEDQFTTFDVQRGIDLEPQAFRAYEARTGLMAKRVGFVRHDTLAVGCSPDGQVGDWQGVIELKVPKSTTHLEYLQGGVVPEDYRAQVLHALYCTGAAWCDFVSYDDRYPRELELFIVRTERNEQELAAYALLVEQFLRECDEAVEALRARIGVAA